MAKYTTLVRSICESKSGLLQSVGGNSVDDVIAKSWDKIFTTKVEFFNEGHRQVLCSKILKHYYMREIGAETAGLWMMWMNTRLEEIMPYYNQMYESETMKYDPLTDVKYKREFDRTNEKNASDSSEYKGESSSNLTGKTTNRYSDTPQGSLQNIENNTYLTSGSIDDRNDNATSNQSSNSTGSSKEDGVEHFVEEISGKHGSADYASMMMKYRESILNIDMMVIEEFKDLFMLIY